MTTERLELSELGAAALDVHIGRLDAALQAALIEKLCRLAQRSAPRTMTLLITPVGAWRAHASPRKRDGKSAASAGAWRGELDVLALRYRAAGGQVPVAFIVATRTASERELSTLLP